MFVGTGEEFTPWTEAFTGEGVSETLRMGLRKLSESWAYKRLLEMQGTLDLEADGVIDGILVARDGEYKFTVRLRSGRDGNIVSTGRCIKAAQLKMRHNASFVDEPSKLSKPAATRKGDTIKQMYGENAVLRRELVIGGEHRYVIDKYTDTVIAKLN